MDSKSNFMDWSGNLYSRFGTLFEEVDGFISQEFKYVEKQFETVGENVQEYYSAFLQDVLGIEEVESPSSPPKIDVNSGTSTSGFLNSSFDAEHQTESCKSETPTHQPLEERKEVLNCNSADKVKSSSGMNLIAEGNTEIIEPSSSETSEEAVSTNENSVVTSRSPDQANTQAAVSTEFQEYVFKMRLGEMMSASDAKKDLPTIQPSVDLTISAESKDKIPDIGVVSCGISSLVTPPDDSDNASDNSESAEVAIASSVIKQVISPTRSELSESCIFVDCIEPFSASESEAEPVYHQKLRLAFLKILKFAKEQKQKKAIFSADVNKVTGDTMQKALTQTLAGESFGSADHQHLCESEWEII